MSQLSWRTLIIANPAAIAVRCCWCREFFATFNQLFLLQRTVTSSSSPQPWEMLRSWLQKGDLDSLLWNALMRHEVVNGLMTLSLRFKPVLISLWARETTMHTLGMKLMTPKARLHSWFAARLRSRDWSHRRPSWRPCRLTWCSYCSRHHKAPREIFLPRRGALLTSGLVIGFSFLSQVQGVTLAPFQVWREGHWSFKRLSRLSSRLALRGGGFKVRPGMRSLTMAFFTVCYNNKVPIIPHLLALFGLLGPNTSTPIIMSATSSKDSGNFPIKLPIPIQVDGEEPLQNSLSLRLFLAALRWLFPKKAERPCAVVALWGSFCWLRIAADHLRLKRRTKTNQDSLRLVVTVGRRSC